MQAKEFVRVVVVTAASIAVVYGCLTITSAIAGNVNSNENNGGQLSTRMGDREGVTQGDDGGRFGYTRQPNAPSVGRGGWGYGSNCRCEGPNGMLGGGV